MKGYDLMPLKKALLLWIVQISLLFSSSAFPLDSPTPKESALSDTVYEDPHGFFRSIQPPRGWEIKTFPNDPRGKVKFIAPDDKKVSILVIGMAVDWGSFDELVLQERDSAERVVEKYRSVGGSYTEERTIWDGSPLYTTHFRIPGQFSNDISSALRGRTKHMFGYASPPVVFEKYQKLAQLCFQSLEVIVRDHTESEAADHVATSKLRVAELNIQDGYPAIALRAVNEGLLFAPNHPRLLELKKNSWKVQAWPDKRVQLNMNCDLSFFYFGIAGYRRLWPGQDS